MIAARSHGASGSAAYLFGLIEGYRERNQACRPDGGCVRGALNDHGGKRVQFACNGVDARQELRIRDHHGRTGVVQHMAQQGSLVVAVNRHFDRAELCQRAPEGDELDAIVQHQQHGVAARDAEAGKAIGEPAGQAVNVAVGEGCCLRQYPRLVGSFSEAPGEHMEERRLIITE